MASVSSLIQKVAFFRLVDNGDFSDFVGDILMIFRTKLTKRTTETREMGLFWFLGVVLLWFTYVFFNQSALSKSVAKNGRENSNSAKTKAAVKSTFQSIKIDIHCGSFAILTFDI